LGSSFLLKRKEISEGPMVRWEKEGLPGEIYIGRVTSLILSIYLLLEGKDW